MELKGSGVYDQTDFFNNYMIRRNRKDSPNNAIEGPIIFELIGSNQDSSVLDLREGTPKREHFSSEDEFVRRQRIPIVLVFSCVKHALKRIF